MFNVPGGRYRGREAIESLPARLAFDRANCRCPCHRPGGAALAITKPNRSDAVPKIDDERVTEIAQMAGVAIDRTFFDWLYDIASVHETRKRQALKELAKTRSSLKAVAASLEKAIRDCGRMQSWTVNQLVGVYRGHHHLSRRELERDLAGAARLSESITILLNSLPERGRPRQELRDELFVEIAKFYEERSGQKFKYPDKRAGFRGSNFVRGLAMVVDPDLSENGCDRGLRAAAKAFRCERKLQK